MLFLGDVFSEDLFLGNVFLGNCILLISVLVDGYDSDLGELTSFGESCVFCRAGGRL